MVTPFLIPGSNDAWMYIPLLPSSDLFSLLQSFFHSTLFPFYIYTSLISSILSSLFPPQDKIPVACAFLGGRSRCWASQVGQRCCWEANLSMWLGRMQQVLLQKQPLEGSQTDAHRGETLLLSLRKLWLGFQALRWADEARSEAHRRAPLCVQAVQPILPALGPLGAAYEETPEGCRECDCHSDGPANNGVGQA